MSPQTSKPAKLPFWRTVGSAYAMPFKHADTLGHVTWLWLGLMTPVLLLMSWIVVPLVTDVMGKIGTPAGRDVHWQLQMLSFVKQIVLLPAVASIAVAWHRFILINEQPHERYLEIDRNVMLYASYVLVTSVVLNGIGHFPVYLAAATGIKWPDWAVGIASVLALPLLLIVARYSPILVAIALGQSDISLGDVWAATRRNTWRMALGPLACIILLGIPGAIMFHLNGMNRLSAAAVLTLLDLISIIGGVVGVSFLSLAYRHFFPMKPYIRMQAVVAPV
jgi:hypothetical protein